MIVEPIGVVKSPVAQTMDENWGNVLSEIHLAPNLAPGLTGIDQFHYIIVVFHMHKASFDPKRDLIRRPQGRPDMPEVGIFAQRAKHRPNPIGMTAVQLTKVDANVLTVRGLDAVDGTPILDIKPYYPAFDRIEVPRSPEWVGRLMEKYFSLEIEPDEVVEGGRERLCASHEKDRNLSVEIETVKKNSVKFRIKI